MHAITRLRLAALRRFECLGQVVHENEGKLLGSDLRHVIGEGVHNGQPAKGRALIETPSPCRSRVAEQDYFLKAPGGAEQVIDGTAIRGCRDHCHVSKVCAKP